MDTTGLSHIALCVRDLDASLAFYRDILGGEVILDEIQDTTKGGLPHLYKHARRTRRTVHVRYGAAAVLVITSHPNEPADGEAIGLDQIGLSHVAFVARDLEGLANDLVAKGVRPAAPLQSYVNSEGRISSALFYDPDGIIIQFDADPL